MAISIYVESTVVPGRPPLTRLNPWLEENGPKKLGFAETIG